MCIGVDLCLCWRKTRKVTTPQNDARKQICVLGCLEIYWLGDKLSDRTCSRSPIRWDYIPMEPLHTKPPNCSNKFVTENPSKHCHKSIRLVFDFAHVAVADDGWRVKVRRLLRDTFSDDTNDTWNMAQRPRTERTDAQTVFVWLPCWCVEGTISPSEHILFNDSIGALWPRRTHIETMGCDGETCKFNINERTTWNSGTSNIVEYVVVSVRLSISKRVEASKW